ncbi:SRPBCC domain-containing protein [Leeuwenhoekiella parthenopeia]|uniref:SRPBCC domain-containing protein n=1 Tax=Leeuwenhoekiella parthenopeia TaxID=2890320 RepID=A0ABS8GVK4_9FLAO|nr:SRPBCC domain-containing protein [Leeuwenhoekiella parthenopeia]MCC4214040.1 SRPBCC domain-containing protein [Leeuwenhoekiella parthenopeia]
MKTKPITVSAHINAEKLKVWEYYTSSEHIVNWNFADPSWHCPEVKNDLQVGGTYFARMEAKDGSFGFDFEAVYTEMNPGNSFTYEFGGRVCKVDLAAAENGTQITVSFDPEDQNPIEMQEQGWQAILNNFKQYTERN